MDKTQPGDGAKRIVITGIGLVTPVGIGKEEFSRRLFAGQSAISEIKSFDTSTFSSHIGAEVTNFQPRDFISLKNIRRMDKISLMTAAACRLALDDAGLQVNYDNRDRIGILLGTAFGATDVTVQFAGTLLKDGPTFVNPILVPNTVMNAPAGHTSIELGFRGVNTTVTHFAVSAETAIAYAVSEIRRGAADFMLTGGVDILSKFYYEALTRFHALSPLDGRQEVCRPFDENRNGAVAGEGCGIICIESLESAINRGHKPYCEIKGFGQGSSPTAPTAWPDKPAGIERTVQHSLKNAGLTANDIQAISAAANGGLILDKVEAEAYTKTFSGNKEKPLITSLKGALGESFSGGGIRAAALALSIDQQALPPTVGLKEPLAPLAFVSECHAGLDPASSKNLDSRLRGNDNLNMLCCRNYKIENALLAGVSFGGTYAYLVFGKYNDL